MATKAKTVSKKTTTKQRPIKHRPLLSTVAKKPAEKRTSKVRHAKTTKRVLSLPLSRSVRLELSIHTSKRIANKSTKKPSVRKQPVQKRISVQRHTLVSIVLVSVGLAGSVFFGLKVFASPAVPPAAPISGVAPTLPIAAAPLKTAEKSSRPIRVRAESIGLNAAVTAVGLKPDGTLDVPGESNVVGWYKASPTPGKRGPSVIVGHVDSKHSTEVFWRLRELTAGQVIEVDREDGQTARFAVVRTTQVSQGADFPTYEVYGNTPGAELRLITCGGAFNRLTGHYADNAIVFAKLIQ